MRIKELMFVSLVVGYASALSFSEGVDGAV